MLRTTTGEVHCDLSAVLALAARLTGLKPIDVAKNAAAEVVGFPLPTRLASS